MADEILDSDGGTGVGPNVENTPTEETVEEGGQDPECGLHPYHPADPCDACEADAAALVYSKR